MKENLHHTGPDDLDLIKKQMLAAHQKSLNLNQFENPEIVSKHEKLTIEELNKVKSNFIKGYETLISEIQRRVINGYFRASDETEEVAITDCILSEDLKKKLLSDNFKKLTEVGENFIDSTGYSNQVILNFYEVAVNLYHEAEYECAESAFIFLAYLKPSVTSFWIGLGLSLEAQKEFLQAIEAFQKAFMTESSDFSPFLGIIRCSQELKDYSKVKEFLKEQKDNLEIQNDVTEALIYIDSLENKG